MRSQVRQDPESARPTVWAVMSAFNPQPELAASVEAVLDQVDGVVLVDDTGVGEVDAIREIAGQHPTVVVLSNVVNLGLAATLNRGVAEAIRRGADHVLTLDQDTVLPGGYVTALRQLVDSADDLQRVLVVAPETVGGRQYVQSHEWERGLCTSFAVQSGLLFDVAAFRVVGKFREDFIIDALELDFFMRLHQVGGHVLVARGIDLVHEVGEPTTQSILRMRIESSNHSTIRRYYITRNHLRCVMEGWRQNPKVCSIAAVWLLKATIKALAVERPRSPVLLSILRGIRDAFRGDLGKPVG